MLASAGGETYRYAFQGQEKDTETGKEAFQRRLWDGRIGRWLTTDPAGQYASPYLGMGNNPVNGIDPDGGKFFDEYDKDGNWLSNLGGDVLNFFHQENGDTKIQLIGTEFSTMISGGEDIIRGYAHRDGDTNFQGLCKEWRTGTGPEKSLIYGYDHKMINPNDNFIDGGVKGTYQVFKATEKYYSNGEKNTLFTGSFGIFGIMRTLIWDTEHFIGKANVSIYNLNSHVLVLVHDSKTISSWTINPFDGKEKNISRVSGKNIPKSTTFQTYMYLISKEQLKNNFELYEISHDE